MTFLPIDSELLKLLIAIADEQKTEDEWKELESSDMFQSIHYVGGYDSIESAFTFSYFTPDKKEYWFQLNLAEIHEVITKKITGIEIRPAE